MLCGVYTGTALGSQFIAVISSLYTPHLPPFVFTSFSRLQVGWAGSGEGLRAAMEKVNPCLLISQIVDKCY